MDAIKDRSTRKIHDCDYCGHTHGKGECLAFGKLCNRCGQKNHFEKKNADPGRDLSLSQDVTQDKKGQIGPMEENAHTDVLCMKLKNVKMTWRT